MQGLTWDGWGKQESISYEGTLAEQFVAQELLAHDTSSDPQPLFYWLREGKKGNAEVDFVIQQGRVLVPIEVKSGAAGSLKSLAQLIAKIGGKSAIKLSSMPPTSHQVAIDANVGHGLKKVVYDLVEVPIYLTGAILRSI